MLGTPYLSAILLHSVHAPTNSEHQDTSSNKLRKDTVEDEGDPQHMKKTLTELSVLDGVLSAFEPRYIRIAKRGKTPIDKEWPRNPMTASNPILSKWIAKGGNYGACMLAKIFSIGFSTIPLL